MNKEESFNSVKKRIRREDYLKNNRIHWFSSKLSPYFSYFFIRLKLSADQVTILFFVTGFTGALISISASTLSYFITYLLWRLHIIIDMSDGDVARFNQSFSHRGKYWDSLIHSVLNPLYSLLIPVGIYFKTNDLIFLFLAILLMFSQHILLASKYNFHADQNTSNSGNNNTIQSDSIKRKILKILSEILGMEGYILSTIILSSLGFFKDLKIILSVYVLANCGIALVKIYQLSYYKKTFSRLD